MIDKDNVPGHITSTASIRQAEKPGDRTSRLTFIGLLPSRMPHPVSFQNLPNHCYQPETKCSTTPACQEHLTFKPKPFVSDTTRPSIKKDTALLT